MKNTQNRPATLKNYKAIWGQFNNFLIKLDVKPKYWEDRVALYCAHLHERNIQSSTMSSYISAIKAILKYDNYKWNDSRVIFSALVQSCKLSNDEIKPRLPIHIGLLEMLLFEVGQAFNLQLYLESMYKALFSLAYYGLLCIGELATGSHTILAKNVHIGSNKDKILLVLYSSKTHSKASNPQKVKIAAKSCDIMKHSRPRNFCPFKITCNYLKFRGPYITDQEQFFVFSDRTPITPENVRSMLWRLIADLGLKPWLYDCHSFRIGRVTDLYKFVCRLEQIRMWG